MQDVINFSSLDKKTLRDKLISKRRSMSDDIKLSLDLEIQSRFLVSDEYRLCDKVLVYVSKEYEIDTLGIISAAFANSKIVAVPKTNNDFTLSFYVINSLSDLHVGKFGVLEPDENNKKLSEYKNSVCVTPSLCCDLNGYRLGFGKGCYDRFFESYSGVKAALCYADSIFTTINTDSNDIPVDVIVTDSYLKRISNENDIHIKEDDYERF